MKGSQIMPDITLHMCPGACSLVPHIALEMAGADFAVNFVDLYQGKQRERDYLALNPRGKVPFLVVDGTPLAENVAILVRLAQLFPAAGILPELATPQGIAALSDLCWFSSGVHPLLTRIMVPGRFVNSNDCEAGLRAIATQAANAEFALIDSRLADGRWWLDEPSAADAYAFFFWARIGDGPFDRTPFKNYANHAQRMLELPAVQRALESERALHPCFNNII
jgi:glutathione S-transferase